MSRHVPRRDRWQSLGPATYRSVDGFRAHFQKGAWWAEVAYRVFAADAPPGELSAWETHHDRLGPFRRPRNAMVEAERHATMLRNRHGDRVEFVEVSSAH
jgi:hypothetical protein